MSDVFRRVGRGGAGNFFTKKEIEEAENRPAEDIEAQKSSVPATTDSSVPAYARGGRGGAGNFHDPSTLPDEKTVEEVAGKTLAAVAASVAKPKVGWRGRGGAGNYSDAPSAAEEAERKRKEEIEEQILKDVNAGLPMPPKAHTGKQKEEV